MFRIGGAAQGAADWALSGPFALVANPLVAALTVAVIAAIVVYAMFREDLGATSWGTWGQFVFYVFAPGAAVLALHYYGLRSRFEKEHENQASDELFKRVTGSLDDDDRIAVGGRETLEGDAGAPPLAGVPAAPPLAGVPVAQPPALIGGPAPGASGDQPKVLPADAGTLDLEPVAL